MKNKCPCCGYYTLEEPKGSYEICPVCFWEEDPAAEQNPNIAYGGNQISLREARENFIAVGACEASMVKNVREPLPEEKDPLAGFSVLRADTFPLRAGAYYVRIQAMNRKYHIPLEMEFDEHDTEETRYVLAMDDGYPIGTVRMYKVSGEEALLGRVVVLPEYRGIGLGKRLLETAEDWARELGVKRCILHARGELVEYYRDAGYTLYPGENFREEPFNCVYMEKNIGNLQKDR